MGKELRYPKKQQRTLLKRFLSFWKNVKCGHSSVLNKTEMRTHGKEVF